MPIIRWWCAAPHDVGALSSGAAVSPLRAQRPCAQPGCPALVAQGSRCPAHATQHNRAHKVAQRGVYSSARHRAWRRLILNRDPICVMPRCGRASTDADHIIPLSMGGTWELSNGAGRCHRCHSRKTAREARDPFLGIRLREGAA